LIGKIVLTGKREMTLYLIDRLEKISRFRRHIRIDRRGRY
jgi:hypothetical protein